MPERSEARITFWADGVFSNAEIGDEDVRAESVDGKGT